MEKQQQIIEIIRNRMGEINQGFTPLIPEFKFPKGTIDEEEIEKLFKVKITRNGLAIELSKIR